MLCTITIDLFKALKQIVSIGNLVDFPTRRVGESFFDYEYLREFEGKFGTAGSVRDSWGTDFCKNPRKSASFCNVPLGKQSQRKNMVWILSIWKQKINRKSDQHGTVSFVLYTYSIANIFLPAVVNPGVLRSNVEYEELRNFCASVRLVLRNLYPDKN